MDAEGAAGPTLQQRGEQGFVVHVLIPFLTLWLSHGA